MLKQGFACGSVAILESATLEELCPPTIPGEDGGSRGDEAEVEPVQQIVFLPDGDAVAVQRGEWGGWRLLWATPGRIVIIAIIVILTI